MPGAHRARTPHKGAETTVKQRFWGPAVAGVAAVVATMLGMGVTSMMMFFGTHHAAGEPWPDPNGPDYGGYIALYLAAVVWFGLFSLIALLYGMLLQEFGERAPYRISLLVMVPPVIVANVLVWQGYAHVEIGHLVATALWAFVLVRWRLVRAHLHLRLPVALVLYPALVVAFILGAIEVSALWYRHSTPERLEAVVLEHPDWEAVSAHHYDHNGVFTSAYRLMSTEETVEVYVDTYPDNHPDPMRACGPELRDCPQHEDLHMFRDEDTGVTQGVYIRTDLGIASLRWRHSPAGEGGLSLEGLAEYVRGPTPDDLLWLSRLLAA